MQDYQKRVVDEKAQLDEKLLKLDAFMVTEVARKLDAAEYERLYKQLQIMNQYSDILGERIKAFK